MILSKSIALGISGFQRNLFSLRHATILGIVLLSLLFGVVSATQPLIAVAAFILILIAIAFGLLNFSLPFVALFLGSTVDIFVHFDLGLMSIMGLCTVIVALGAWCFWFMRVSDGLFIPGIAWPWITFIIWCSFCSFILFSITTQGVQNIFVTIAFVGIMLLSAAMATNDQSVIRPTGQLITWSAWIAAVLFQLGPILGAIDPRLRISNRSFALFALLGVAWFWSQSRYGKKNASWQAIVLTLFVALSLSRTATTAALLLLVLSRFDVHRIRGWVTFFGAGTISAAAGYTAVTQVESIRSRFTEGDVSMTVAGIPINASGRTEAWEVVLESFWTSPWIGQGANTSSTIINPVLGHPHNDYLRLLHDFGIVGFSIWLIAQISLMTVIFRAWLRSDRHDHSKASLHLTALLSLLMIYITMFTDNVIAYAFIMLPVGVIVGTSLGIIYREESTESKDTHFSSPANQREHDTNRAHFVPS